MVRMRVAGLTIDPQTRTPMTILREQDGHVVVPVWIGALEAMSISLALNSEAQPRPLAHELLLQCLNALDASLVASQITGLEDGVYRAHLVLQGAAGISRVDCRPADAIVLSLRARAPLLVSEDVLARSAAAQQRVQERLREEDPSLQAFSQSPLLRPDEAPASTEEKYRQILRTLDPVSSRKM